jgi:hypothetical protein
MDDLGLEIVLGVEDVQEGEVLPPAPPLPSVKTVRRSHQLAARMLAQGASVQLTAAHVGMHPGRLYTMLEHDTTFKELVAAHVSGFDHDEDDLQRQFNLASQDFLQLAHQKVFEEGEEISAIEAMEMAKIASDRGGNAPIGRSVSKSLSLHVGLAEAMDREKRLKEVK